MEVQGTKESFTCDHSVSRCLGHCIKKIDEKILKDLGKK